MRRKYLVPTVLLLSMANAFSLSNFQSISSSLIPDMCFEEYNSEISNCNKQDFDVKCSDSCKKSLKKVATDVTTACLGVILNPNSLLGIVKNGGIITALCSNPGDPSSITSSTSKALQSTTTSNPPQTTSTLQRSTTSSSDSSTTQTLTQPDSTTTTAPSSSSTAEGNGGGQQTSTTPARTSDANSVRPSSTSTSPVADSEPTSDTGGGSPFDISSGASRSETRSTLGILVLGGWTLALLVR